MARGERAPYMQFYVNDYLNDIKVVTMDMEERGIYTTLLFSAWAWADNNTPPLIPADHSILASICRIEQEKIDAFFAKYPSLFMPTEDGQYLYNKRLFDTYEEMNKQAKKLSDAGKKAIETRWEKERNSKKNTTVLRPNYQTETETETYKTLKPKTSIGDEASPDSAQISKIEPCPYTEIVKLYNEILPECPACRELNQTRKRQLFGIWKRGAKWQDLEQWRRFFSFIRDSDFLMGRVESNGHNNNFNLEWFTKPRNFLNICEGKYHDRKGRHDNGNNGTGSK